MASAKPEAQLDLFVGRALFGAQSVRDDIDFMSFPFLSPSKSTRLEPIEFNRTVGNRDVRIKVSGGKDGIATVWDYDILLYLRTMTIEALNRGEPVGREFVFSVHDCLRTIGRGTGGQEYTLFRAALQRLKTTTIFTNITAGDEIEDQAVGWIDSYSIRGRKSPKGGEAAGSCKIEVSKWLFALFLDTRRSLSVDMAYFNLKGGLERKLYMICRRHLGQQSVFHIAVDKLYEQTGAQMPIRQFRYTLKKMIETQALPGFALDVVSQIETPLAGKPGVVAKRRKPTDVLVVRPRR